MPGAKPKGHGLLPAGGVSVFGGFLARLIGAAMRARHGESRAPGGPDGRAYASVEDHMHGHGHAWLLQ